MIEKWIIPARPLRRNMTVHVHLPENYHQSDQRYPVMYMFDGHNLFEDEQATYGTSWKLEDFLNGFEKDFIVIGLECDHFENNRLQEYCPYPLESTFFGPSNGLGAALFEWMENTLKPFVDQKYRTWPHREATGIGGSSMGGLMAAYGALEYNHLFSKAACLSPSLIIAPELFLRALESLENADTRMYFSFGENELPQNLKESALIQLEMAQKLLENKGAKGKVVMQRQGGHNEQSWSQLTADWVSFLWMNGE